MSVSDDGVVGTVTIGSKDGAAVEEARRRIELILDPPTAELGAEYTGQGREHHQVRCVRQHPPRPRRPAAHLQARSGQAHRPGRGRAQPRRRGRRCGSTTSTTRASSRCRSWATSPTAATAAAATPAAARATRAATAREPRRRVTASRSSGSERRQRRRRRESASFEDVLGRRRPSAEFGDLGPAEAGRAGGDRGGGGGGGGGRRGGRRWRAPLAGAEPSRPVNGASIVRR